MTGYNNHNIPEAAHTFIDRNISAGILTVAFGPRGSWVCVAANGACDSHGIPRGCKDALRDFLRRGFRIRSIAFPPQGGDRWVVVADQDYSAQGIPDECIQVMDTFRRNKWPMRHIAFPPSGGNSWVIVGTDRVFARSIDDECYQILNNHMQGQRPASGVSFTPDGGWTIFGSDEPFARRIHDDCYRHLRAIAAQGDMIDHVSFVPDGDGYSIIANQASPFTSPNLIRVFENNFFRDSSGKGHSVWARMAAHGVPGVSVAMVLGGAFAWQTSYGVLEAGGQQYVYNDTPFQVASISKPTTAVGVLRSAQGAGANIGLDDPVQQHTTWTIPVQAGGSASWVNEATVALTLAHEGGFNVPGFGGYPDTGTQLPTLDQILAGTPPVNSPKIEIMTRPGPRLYSGGGYVALQRMMQDVTATNFVDWMQSNVLTPLGMSGSTFAVTLPPQLSRAATGHVAGPVAINGKRNRYPESAAAGLYSNVGDLCRIILMLNSGGSLDGVPILTRAMRDRMLLDELGISRSGALAALDCMYAHDGVNAGFYALMRGYPNLGSGFAITTNADHSAGGSAFVAEVVAALEYLYPRDLLPSGHSVIGLDSDQVSAAALDLGVGGR
ncbi:CubicO group peptidase, beta-lactamase class C family [Geodermatophilus siccatus]|uniref:CubicO group peptidase, beta-lactamase class C family n=1 Tax=Geodermatophilus siccatus TaxID=1137991 RepID=A0A1G9VXN1_9ACTN|nr:serine hydrolase domain-containing protein [Geodermatophilus siccatus]SDM76970.1 CubicO group peptidase, beta-lactamase class C family [Geodermatophilus siccatus]